jgi:hypothetical protein
VLWFFDREHESLCIETRYDDDTFEFVALVIEPNGRQRIKRFPSRDGLWAWLNGFTRTLQNQRWRLRGGGSITLPYSWSTNRPP